MRSLAHGTVVILTAVLGSSYLTSVYADESQDTARLMLLEFSASDPPKQKKLIDEWSRSSKLRSNFALEVSKLPVNQRAEGNQLVALLRDRWLLRLREQIKSYAEQDRIDFLIEAIAQLPKSNDPESTFSTMTEYVGKVLNREVALENSTEYYTRKNLALGTLKDFKKASNTELKFHEFVEPLILKNRKQIPLGYDDSFHFIRAPHVSIQTVLGDMPKFLLSSSDIEIISKENAFLHSVILSNGNLRLKGCRNSIIISDGNIDIEGENYLQNCFVMCRGNLNGIVIESLVAIKGDYSCHAFTEGLGDSPATYRLGGKALFKPREGVVLKQLKLTQNMPNPFGQVKFFETLELGVHTAQKEQQVFVQIAEPKLLLGKAGFQKNDIVESVNGNRVDSPETFRKLVRQAIIDTRAEFVLNRNGEKKKIAIEFPLDCLKEAKSPR